MKKSENLVATLLAVYSIILTICIGIYAMFKLMQLDVDLAASLLNWSATIFASIAVLMTYTSWREQKQAELISNEVRKYLEILHRLESFEFTVVDRINYETSLIDLIDEYSLFLQKFSDTGFFCS